MNCPETHLSTNWSHKTLSRIHPTSLSDIFSCNIYALVLRDRTEDWSGKLQFHRTWLHIRSWVQWDKCSQCKVWWIITVLWCLVCLPWQQSGQFSFHFTQWIACTFKQGKSSGVFVYFFSLNIELWYSCNNTAYKSLEETTTMSNIHIFHSTPTTLLKTLLQNGVIPMSN